MLRTKLFLPALGLVAVACEPCRVFGIGRAVEVPEIARLFTDDVGLPGRDLVFTDLGRAFGLDDLYHAPITPMMEWSMDVTVAAVRAAKAELHAGCLAALESNTPESRAAFNAVIVDYMEFRGADVDHHTVNYLDTDGRVERVDHRVHVRPTSTGTGWHARLARSLGELALPVQLFVFPRLLQARRFEAHYSQDSEGLSIGLSPASLPSYVASLSLEHELFHVLQTQFRAVGRTDAWPDHVVKSSNPAAFHGQARRYVDDQGYFALEEIGASTRDAVQIVRSVAEGRHARLAEDRGLDEGYLIQRDRRAALSFVKGAEKVYRRASRKMAAGEITRGSLREVPEDNACELVVDAETSLRLPRFALDAHALEHVRAEIGRALGWIAAYRRFLVSPLKHQGVARARAR